jgi:predicted nucleic-acid-binding Zn-ribbon protein
MAMVCTKCGSAMAGGYLMSTDGAHNTVGEWVEGRPEKRWWGLNLKNRRRYPVAAARCQRCGFLELYAVQV